MITYTHVPRVVYPRRWGGSDWDSEQVVLVRRVKLIKKAPTVVAELRWWKSSKSWGDRMSGYVHRPAALILVTATTRGFGVSTPTAHAAWNHERTEHLAEGGRFSKKRLIAFHNRLVDLFGSLVLYHFHVKQTLVVSV